MDKDIGFVGVPILRKCFFGFPVIEDKERLQPNPKGPFPEAES